jgi:hypothetical protein
MRSELGGGKVGDMGVDCMGASDVKVCLGNNLFIANIGLKLRPKMIHDIVCHQNWVLFN